MTVAALFVLRTRLKTSSYQARGDPVTPILFLALVAVLLVLLGGDDPKQALLGVAVVALGLPVYELIVCKK